MNHCYFLIILWTLYSSCTSTQLAFKTINFTNPYLFDSEIEHQLAQDTVPWKYQISASEYAIKGDYQKALEHWDLGRPGRSGEYTSSEIDSLQSNYKIVSARDYIIEQAPNHDIIIINEAHHNNYHRVFTKSLLKQLFDLGYTKFGLEALGNGIHRDTLLNERKYPLQQTGYYTRNPQFGDLVRQALNIGFEVFPYEQTTNKNGKQREIEQARNIEAMIQLNPDEKFIIHCGFDHAMEGSHGSWEKAMAGRLQEYTGIDPLTINQVVYSENGNHESNHPLLKALKIQESSILLDRKNQPFKYERGNGWMDIAVLHPNTRYSGERPNWLFDNETIEVSISIDHLNLSFPVMLLIYEANEPLDTAVPVDILEIEAREDAAVLALKKGNYELIIVDKNRNSYLSEIEN
ncbi:MAG: hypothetical protein KJP00_01160 [Bacteroidia bacterium]|nr:hypothetical protein [Bacteroidia bacterium]